MQEIQLTKGQVALVDDEDFEWLNRWKWAAGYFKSSNGYYAQRHETRLKVVRMHRIIMGVTDRKIQVDHINHNTLDNRRCNLRLSTVAQNHMNKRKLSNNKSGYIGVRFHHKKWEAQIMANGMYFYLGCYDTAELASQAYQDASTQLFGEFKYGIS
jgi:hypothetical protein